MERKLAVLLLLAVAVTLGLTVGVVYAQVGAAPPAAAPAAAKVRDWYDYADVILRVGTLIVLSGGLVGTFAVLTSLRAGVYSQIYGRFQGVLLKMVEHPQLFERMKREEYTAAEDDPTNTNGSTHPQRFLANCMVNLYEEAFLIHEARVLSVIDTVPDDYWQSMLGSMRAAFQLRYVRTHWERRQAVFSPKFNRFVREAILSGPQSAGPAEL
jgi:hypothetical protein